jgi:hypothetical protein
MPALMLMMHLKVDDMMASVDDYVITLEQNLNMSLGKFIITAALALIDVKKTLQSRHEKDAR